MRNLYIFLFLYSISNFIEAKVFCRDLDHIFEKIEEEENIPKDLLKAISIQESSRPWAWTVAVNGKGYFFKTKKEAVDYVQTAMKVERNIDVGCMQINMIHHRNAFKSLDEAFIPENNIRYAAKFLRSLYEMTNSWECAVERYHSANVEFSKPYKKKVFNIWVLLRDQRLSRINVQTKLQRYKNSFKNHYIKVFYNIIGE